MSRILQIHPDDNVAVALEPLKYTVFYKLCQDIQMYNCFWRVMHRFSTISTIKNTIQNYSV